MFLEACNRLGLSYGSVQQHEHELHQLTSGSILFFKIYIH